MQMNGIIAPKSNVVEVVDPVSQWGRQVFQDAVWRVSWRASGVRTVGMPSKDFM